MHIRYEIVIEEFHDADSNKDLKLNLAKDLALHRAQQSEHSEQPEQTVLSDKDQDRYTSDFTSYDKNNDGLIGLHEARRPTSSAPRLRPRAAHRAPLSHRRRTK